MDIGRLSSQLKVGIATEITSAVYGDDRTKSAARLSAEAFELFSFPQKKDTGLDLEGFWAGLGLRLAFVK